MLYMVINALHCSSLLHLQQRLCQRKNVSRRLLTWCGDNRTFTQFESPQVIDLAYYRDHVMSIEPIEMLDIKEENPFP